MPELPEVETIGKQLKNELVGKVVRAVEVLREKSFQGDEKQLVGKKITDIGRKGKTLAIYFDDFSKVVLIHLKMTGQLVYLNNNMRVAGGHPTVDWVRDLPSSHTRVVWSFEDGSKLFFNDMRVFGWHKLVTIETWEKMKNKLPPDVVEDGFTLKWLKEKVLKGKRAVKLSILDQQKVGGMGNIYANDALFLAKINPERKSDALSEKDSERLWGAMKEVIEKGIRYGGASAADEKFVDLNGVGGKYQDHFLVYQRDGKNCLNCGEKIKKIKLGGRGTYYCPNCQK